VAPPNLFLEGMSRPLLLVHAALAVVLAGSATHLASQVSRALVARRPFGDGVALHSTIVGLSYLASFATGLMLYPAYRVRVRALYLDRHAPWASNLFDLKENLLGLGLPLALALLFIGRARSAERPLPQVVAYLSWAVWALAIGPSLMGLLVTAVKGVGA
jgi:hypothetical protein